MPNLKSIHQLNFDAATSPLRSDMIQFIDKIIQTFYLQPNVIRKLHVGTPIPAFLDGKQTAEIPEIEEGDRPAWEFEPTKSNTVVTGTTQEVRMPQLYQSAAMSEDAWKLTFAGKNKKPLVMKQIRTMVLREEDYRGFTGSTVKQIDGLTSPSASDLGTPPGVFDVQSNSDGVLTYLDQTITEGLNEMVDLDVPVNWPVNMVMTGRLFNLAKNTFMAQTGGGRMNNLEYNKQKLNGGNIWASNNINGSTTKITNTTNEMLMVAMPPDDTTPIWKIVESGFEFKEYPEYPWGRGLAVRKKFSLKVLNDDGIRYMKDIQAVTV